MSFTFAKKKLSRQAIEPKINSLIKSLWSLDHLKFARYAFVLLNIKKSKRYLVALIRVLSVRHRYLTCPGYSSNKMLNKELRKQNIRTMRVEEFNRFLV